MFLIVFGLIMIYSSSAYSVGVDGDASYFLRHQVLVTVLGVFVVAVMIHVDYHIWRYVAIPSLFVSFVLILLVLTPMGMEVNGARRWIHVSSLSMQPAEVVKISIILFCAFILNQKGSKILYRWKGFFKFMIAPTVFAGMLYVITDNLSSAIIVFGIAWLMAFVADKDYKKYLVMVGSVLAIGAAVVLYAALGDHSGFRLRRIQVWLDPASDSQGTGYQTLQALYAIGSGGIRGKGLGNSLQKIDKLPEAQNDMIFSIVCEELGLVGAIMVIIAFVVLIWRCMIIARNAKDFFGSMLVVGVLSHFAIQVILNMAVVTNLIPNTGISLPFISYGGTSSLFLMIEIGLVLNVSKQIVADDEEV
ncbi:MAG: putative lipid II flippase FtsW [Lachnospiraceae bacterium]|nr:putative lipid II flippase FtsW [Lachnospiraceae bacterium]